MVMVVLTIVAAPIFYVHDAMAMNFSFITMPDGLRVVLASGEIVVGDAARLRSALEAVARDKWGHKTLALNSPGGSVGEALRIVDVMDEVKVTTIVPPLFVCASACSQILFIVGVHRVVIDGGMLGMHSCSSGDGLRSDVCNEKIAANALAHGVEYGTVMAPTQYAGPTQMIWFSAQDADCWGLTRWPPGFDRGIQQGEVAPCVRRAIAGVTSQPKPVVRPAPPTRRFSSNRCGGITDMATKLDWYVGPDRNFGWQEASMLAATLQNCGGGWELPTANQVSALFDAAKSAGAGYFTGGRYFPALIDPIFSGIGSGSWIWLRGNISGGRGPAYNLNQNIPVSLAADGTQAPTRVFAVRTSRGN